MGTQPHRRGSEFESHVDDERLVPHPAMVAVQADRGQGAEWLIYVGCGSGVTSDGSGINLKDWWEYRVNTNAWTQRDDLPGPARVS